MKRLHVHVAVADIDIGRAVADKRVTDKADNFKPSDTIYTSVHTTGTATAANIMARWTFEDGQVVDEMASPTAEGILDHLKSLEV